MLHARIAAAAVMTPDRYLTLRRQAAGLSVQEAAAAAMPTNSAGAATIIRLWETPGVRAHYGDLEQLRRAFPFDPAVYRQLAEEPADRHPSVCRICACSHWDPCEDHEHGGACGWSEPDRCTRCAFDVDDPDGVQL